jgi:hypothetical protein
MFRQNKGTDNPGKASRGILKLSPLKNKAEKPEGLGKRRKTSGTKKKGVGAGRVLNFCRKNSILRPLKSIHNKRG